MNNLIGQGTVSIAPAKATGHAIVAAALGMAYESQILIDIARGSNMPASMLEALKELSKS